MIAALVVGAVLVVTALVLVLTLRVRRPDVDWRPDRRYPGERWRVRTPRGPVVVTRVMDDRGLGYEVDARFRSGRVTSTVPPSILLARERVDALVRGEP